MIALKKKSKATKCSDHRTYSRLARLLTRRIERKIEDVVGEDQFGCRRRKGTSGVIVILRIIQGGSNMTGTICV
jgi:hypothetical protein